MDRLPRLGPHASRKRENPLAHRHVWDDAVPQVGSGLRHAPRPTRGAKPAPLTRDGHQLLVCTLRAAQTQKPVGEDATLEKISNSSSINSGTLEPVSAST